MLQNGRGDRHGQRVEPSKNEELWIRAKAGAEDALKAEHEPHEPSVLMHCFAHATDATDATPVLCRFCAA